MHILECHKVIDNMQINTNLLKAIFECFCTFVIILHCLIHLTLFVNEHNLKLLDYTYVIINDNDMGLDIDLL